MEGAIPDPPAGAASPDLAMKALVGMCPQDMNQGVSNEAVAAFLILAQRFGWNPLFVLEPKTPAPYCDDSMKALTLRQMEGLTVLEWLSLFSHTPVQRGYDKNWPATAEALDRLEHGSSPPVHDHEWLMVWMILNGAALWENTCDGIPVVLLNFITRNHLRLVALLLQQSGAPSLKTLLALPWHYSENRINVPRDYTFGKWLFEQRPELVKWLLNHDPEPLLNPEMAAYASPELMLLLKAKTKEPTWTEVVKAKLDSRLISDFQKFKWSQREFFENPASQGTKPVFGPDGWLAAHKVLFEPLPWSTQSTSFRQAVIDYTLDGPHGPNKAKWFSQEKIADPASFLLNMDTTHLALKGRMSVLAALLLNYILQPPQQNRNNHHPSWAAAMGWTYQLLADCSLEEAQATWKSLDGLLAGALDQTFGEGFSMSGLIALAWMRPSIPMDIPQHLANCLPSDRELTLEGLLFGVSDRSDFLEKHFKDAMDVTYALMAHLQPPTFENASHSKEVMLISAWRKSLTHARDCKPLFFSPEKKLAMAELLEGWTGLWYPMPDPSRHDSSHLLAILVDHYTAPNDPFEMSSASVESDLFVTMALITRRVDWLSTVMNGLTHRRLTPSQVEQCEQWLERETAFIQEHYPSSDPPPSGEGYPLRLPILAEFKQALLQTQLRLETTDSSQRQRL